MEFKVEEENFNSTSALSNEDVINKNTYLVRHHSNLKEELNKKLQQIHDYKRELIRLKTLKIEYISEIDSLQTLKGSEYEKLKLKVENLEKQKQVLNCQHSEQINHLQQIISKKGEELSKLQDELESVSNISNSAKKKSENDELISHNAKFKDVINELQNEAMVLKEKIDFLEKQQLMNKVQNNTIQEELNTLHENYENKKEKLDEAKQLNETLQEDIILARQELEVVRSKPLQDGSQGNSLFAEVDNKRLELEEKMAFMKSQYLKMKYDYGKSISKVASLTSINEDSCRKWETELQDYDNNIIEEKYRERLKLLESQIEVYIGKILSKQTIPNKNLETGEIHFMQYMLETKNKEIVTTLRQGDSCSLSRIMLSCQLRDTNVEMRKFRAKTTKLEFEMAKLRAEIEAQELKNNSKKEIVPIAQKCVILSKNKKSILKSQSVDNIIAHLNNADDAFSRIDYSRLIKRSRSRGFIDRNSKGVEDIACDNNKENAEMKREIKPPITVSKKIEHTDYSNTNTSKLEKVIKKKC